MTSSPPTSPPTPANNSTSPPPSAPTYTQIYDQLFNEWPNLKDKLMQPTPAGPTTTTEPNPLDGDE